MKNIVISFILSRTQYLKDWSLTEIQSYVVQVLFKRYFKVLKPRKLILNIHKIIRGYSRNEKLKFYELQQKEWKFSLFLCWFLMIFG